MFTRNYITHTYHVHTDRNTHRYTFVDVSVILPSREITVYRFQTELLYTEMIILPTVYTYTYGQSKFILSTRELFLSVVKKGREREGA